MSDIDIKFQEEFNHNQSIFMVMRQIQLGIGCAILLFIIIAIAYSTPWSHVERLIVFNTTRMLFFCCVCYFVGMAIVLVHQGSWVAGYRFAYDSKELSSN